MTRKNFERINFEEAEILEFDYFSEPFNKIEFDIWGARFLIRDAKCEVLGAWEA